jgi:hypothetical protein
MIQVTIINGIYALSAHGEYATADSIMGSDIRFFDSIANPCLRRRRPSQYVCFAFRIRSNKGRFGPPYSVVNRGWALVSRSQKDIRRDNSSTLSSLGTNQELLRGSMSGCEALKTRDWEFQVAFDESWQAIMSP